MTVAELHTRMSASEFEEWRAFERIEGPIGDRRGDLQAAAVAYWSLIPHLGEKYRDVSLNDLLLQYGEGSERDLGTPEEVYGFDG